MKLIADLGNTFQKYYLFEGDKLMKEITKPGKPSADFIQKLLSDHGPFRAAIISSAIDLEPWYIPLLTEHTTTYLFSSDTALPVTNRYKTPDTLGPDRLAAAVAGHLLFPGKPVLVIDAGTCIKYDFITSHGEYLGGGISPGVEMRLKAMHTFTDKLPLVDTENFDNLYGNDTKSSLLMGAVKGAKAEVDGIITLYREKYDGLQLVLSGGDRNYFDKTLKNSIFAIPNVVAVGLNKILDYNESIIKGS